jgi:protein-glutamine gamma-glutamyltransferase
VSGVAAQLDAPLRSGPTQAGAAHSARVDDNVAGVLRLGVFVAFATFSLGHWLGVLQNPPTGRGLLIIVVCTVGAAALWLTGQPAVPRRVGQIARPLIVVVMALLALLAAGLSARYLAPHGWHRLGKGLNRGLLGAEATIYPYTGGDPWVRLTLMLAGPLFLVPAAALAFWPAPRAGGAMRAAALVLMISLFGMALAERTPNAQIGRGLALLVLIAAWLWLPRLRSSDAAAAAAALAVAAVVALPLVGALDGSKGWFDYRNWRIFSAKGGITYAWDQTYGPIDWPRRGTTLLFVKADQPYYWKAEALNSFNGTRWIGSSANDGTNPSSEIPAVPNRKWLKKLEVNVVGLRGNLVVGAGTPFRISADAGDTTTSADGTTTAVGHELRDGEHYSVTAYVPQPTPAQMRAAAQSYENYYERYTSFSLPGPAPETAEPVTMALRGEPGSGTPGADATVLASPYAGMFRLAQNLAANQPTTYDVANTIADYLRSSRFAYSERPPLRQYPLESFVTTDRIGYCQQFSGAMALMLRMNGIPARVVSGFAPGQPVTEAPGEFRVRDLDAHAWVEVYFTDIGWVTFDPTPSSSPASSQLDDGTTAAAQGGRTARGLGQSQAPEAPGVATGFTPTQTSHSSSGLLLAAALAAGLALLVLAGLWLRTWLLHRRAGGDAAEMALEELRTAVVRIGLVLAPSTTLAALEQRLRTVAGPDAVRYAQRLREYRYGPEGGQLPSRADRRALRRALARSAGPLGRIKAVRALPPAPHLPWRH